MWNWLKGQELKELNDLSDSEKIYLLGEVIMSVIQIVEKLSDRVEALNQEFSVLFDNLQALDEAVEEEVDERNETEIYRELHNKDTGEPK